jgi:phenylacetate-CoA oxygenase PaaH subunit
VYGNVLTVPGAPAEADDAAARAGAAGAGTAPTAAPPGGGVADSQWELYEVFTQEAQGAPHEHAGSVRAADPAHAIQNARDVYAPPRPRAQHVGGAHGGHLATSPADAEPFFDPGSDKPYRHPHFYKAARRARRMSADARAGGAQEVPDARLAEYLLRHGDDRLVLGHRLSEWAGHAPILEEDHRVGNLALDLIGQGAALLGLAGAAEGAGRDADALAYLREAVDFRNALVCELPRGDFAHTMVRQFLFDAYDVLVTRRWPARRRGARGRDGQGVQGARYHVRHSGEWVVRLGDGTERAAAARRPPSTLLWRTGPSC